MNFKKFRQELLEFINHNISVGNINHEMRVEDFKKYVEIDLGKYINVVEEVIK